MRFEVVDKLLPQHFEAGLLSVAVFGPGIGEAVVVGFPDRTVGVVDGCRETMDPVSELLGAWGMPDIRFICLTHPHQDHYAGLGRLIRAHVDRIQRIGMVSMLQDPKTLDALNTWVRTKAGLQDPDAGVIRGLEELIAAVGDARSTTRLVHLTGRSRVMRFQVPDQAAIEVLTIGPAANDEHLAQEELLSGRSERFDPNRTSAALAIHFGQSGVMLCGDLVKSAEKGDETNPNCGWLAAGEHIDFPVQVTKAPHHASEGAHCSRFWGRPTVPNVVLVTPFQKAAGKQPPRREMLAQLAQGGRLVIVTSPPAWLTADEKAAAGLTSAGVVPKAPRAFASPSPAPVDRHNAVLVALDDQGVVHAITLAGQARFYGPDGLPEPPPTPAGGGRGIQTQAGPAAP